MTTQIFNKVSLNFKCVNGIFQKYSCSIHCASNTSPLNVYTNLFSNNKVLVTYFSNKRNFSSISDVCLHQQAHPKILSYNKDTVISGRIPTNHHDIVVNSVRQYTNTISTIVDRSVKYNGGIFQIISESSCVEWITELLRLVHSETGLPWWATIMLVTFLARITINLPLQIFDLKNRAKQENLIGEMTEISKRIKWQVESDIVACRLTPRGAYSAYLLELSQEQKKLYQRENCHPLKGIAMVLLQAPVWITFSVAVRNMCFMLPYRNYATLQDFNELSVGGFGWMVNLTQVDHLYILPIIFGLSSLALIEINQVLFNKVNTRSTRIYKNIVRICIICIAPLMAFVPSYLSLFWVTNNFCIVLQSLLLLSPKVRRLVRIPKTDLEVQQPYKQLLDKFTFKRFTKKA